MEERKAMRDQWLKESDAVHDAVMRSYKENYWAETILLRFTTVHFSKLL
jgi:hypothetical protein